MKVPEPVSSNLEDQEPERSNGHGADTSGFGLVNWLFDHINARKPIFLSLFAQYDKETKLFSDYKWIGYPVLGLCLLWDGVMFLVYMVAVAAIIAAITFIFVKGSGVLDYLDGNHTATETTQTQNMNVQAGNVNIGKSKG